ncbi:MAG: cobalt ECF transporter T component CbiQ [Nitrospirae bacterium]|nr:cobalt ECF transporter T component CbiQ [Nitrospirota bacterium]NTW64883.1 cobalt ECF transporter T component CbiQ [Nitrospirota bacterium]
MSFDTAYYSIGRLDRLSYQDTVIHRLDPRVKVIATILFIITVISYPKYEVIALAPFFLFPVLLVSLGDIPVLFLLKKIVIVSPFAIFIGMFNPVFDRGTVLFLGRSLSAGWISYCSILLKFSLTISAALLLIATTSFPGVCHALRRFGLPALFVSQLLFLYRYLFVLMEETMRIVRARDMRSFGKRGSDARTTVRIVGMLFLRTVERAERIYSAMLSRGFSGDMPSMKRQAIGGADLLFLVLTVAALAVFRLVPVPELIGRLLQGGRG